MMQIIASPIAAVAGISAARSHRLLATFPTPHNFVFKLKPKLLILEGVVLLFYRKCQM